MRKSDLVVNVNRTYAVNEKPLFCKGLCLCACLCCCCCHDKSGFPRKTKSL